MYRTEVKVAFRWDIGNIHGNVALFAECPYFCRGLRVIDGRKNHVHTIKIRRCELSIDMRNLLHLYPICNLFIQTLGRTNNCDFGIGIKDIEDTACSNLYTAIRMEFSLTKCWNSAYLSPTNDKDILISNLPCENERSATLYLGELWPHGGLGTMFVPLQKEGVKNGIAKDKEARRFTCALPRVTYHPSTSRTPTSKPTLP